MKKLNLLLFTFLMLTLVVCEGLNLSQAAPVPSDAYGARFPYYAEVCGFGKKDQGNPGGHAIVYLKGVCRTQHPKSLIQLCDSAELAQDPYRGTVLSVNTVATNLNWVAVESRDLALYGGLSETDPLNDATYNQMIQRMIDSGTYKVVSPQKKYQREHPAGVSLERFITGKSFGIDFGIAYARRGTCWKIPVAQEQMKAMVDFANGINESITKDHPNHWDFLSNNCNHFVMNVLAAGNIVKPVKVNLIFPASVPHLWAPVSTIVDIGRKVRKSLPTVTELYKSSYGKTSLKEYGQPPLPFGTVMEVIPFREAGNLEFHRQKARWAWPGEEKDLDEMETDHRLSDFKTSLQEYSIRLEEASQRHQTLPLQTLAEKKKKWRDPDFADFYRLYSEWLTNTRIELDLLMMN